jgi:hypothetical protein
MTTLDVLHHCATYPYTTPALQEALAADAPLPAHRRLLRLAAATAESPNADADDLVEARTLAVLPQAAALRRRQR